MEVGADHLDLEADGPEQAGDELLSALHPGAEARVGGDAGMADKFLQFGDGVEHSREGDAVWTEGGRVTKGGKARAPKRFGRRRTGGKRRISV